MNSEIRFIEFLDTNRDKHIICSNMYMYMHKFPNYIILGNQNVQRYNTFKRFSTLLSIYESAWSLLFTKRIAKTEK